MKEEPKVWGTCKTCGKKIYSCKEYLEHLSQPCKKGELPSL